MSINLKCLIIKQISFIRSLFVAFVLSLWMCCTYQESSVSTISSFVLPKGKETIYQLTDRYYLVTPTDTALFYGTSLCTLITNGSVTRVYADSSYMRTITLLPQKVSGVSPTVCVFPQILHYGKTGTAIDQISQIHYFRIEDTAIFYVAKQANGLIRVIPLSEQLIMPRVVQVGSFDTIISSKNAWQTTGIIADSIFNSFTHSTIQYKSVATKAVAQAGMPSYILNGVIYKTGIEVKTYALVSDITKEYQLHGSAVIERRYFKNIGLVDEKIVLWIQKTYTSPKTEVIRLTIIHQRGPEGAKVWPD